MGMEGCGDAGMWGCRDVGMPELAGATREAVQRLHGAVFAAGYARLQQPAPHLHHVQLLLRFGFTTACGEPWARLFFKASYHEAIRVM